jgi:23S rRNA pseudouridine2605 synthase
MRINQFLAHSLGFSRREAEKYISGGLVELNGEIAQLFNTVSESDNVKIYIKEQWKQVQALNSESTILFYKPIFTVTTRMDPQKRQTVYDKLPRKYHNLKPAGRLDYMSEGLLVLSSDGNLIQKLTHPSFDCHKLYLVGTKNILPPAFIQAAKNGMTLEDVKLESVKVTPITSSQIIEYKYLKLQNDLHWNIFELKEGRNNQIRKMCQEFGLNVQRLIRIKHGDYKLHEGLYINKIISI